MEPIVLKIRARHFKDADFISNDDCPVARAAKDQFQAKDVSEAVHRIYVGKHTRLKVYAHEYYNDKMFDRDRRKARGKVHNKIIRELTLTPVPKR